MANKWTEAQKKAIESKGSTLVSASAGTGKTAVLTQKVTNTIVNDGIDIKNILVMTFSNAAADEMKERIRAKLNELAADKTTKPATRGRIRTALRSFYASDIETIHAFCNETVKAYFYKTGLDPRVSIADTADSEIMKLSAARQALDIQFASPDPDFTMFEEYVDGTDTIENVIIKTHEKMMSFIEPWEWLSGAVEKYNIPDGTIPAYVTDMIVDDFKYAEDKYCRALSILESMNDPKMMKNHGTMSEDLAIIRNIIKGLKKGNKSVMEMLSGFGQTVRFPAKDASFDTIKELRTAGRDRVLKNYKGFSITEQLDRIRSMYGMAKKFEEIIKDYNRLYTEQKKEANVIDFNDMERHAYEILKDDSISLEFRNKYERVFVDEYQDTSPIQEAIITKISRKNNQFFVGDLKQSIYGFRASEPALFKDRSEKYKKNASLGSVIALRDNFRSSQNILDCANDVFKNITKQSRDLEYSTEEMLVHGRQDEGACTPVVVDILSDSIKDMIPGTTSEEIEVYNIVRTIRNRVGKPIYDTDLGKNRPAEYRDIVVSCRKLTGLTDTISQIFHANGIPFFIERAGNLLETVEVQVLINLIDLVNSENNDIAAISVVHEGLFGFTDEDMLALRKSDLSKPFLENISDMAGKEGELGNKCQKMLSFLDSIRIKEPVTQLTEMLEYIIRGTCLFDLLAVQKNGRQKIANIKLLQKMAYDFQEKSNEKLYGFMNYLGKILETETAIDEAKVNYSENCVRVTTIHKSKGLEYPVEIMAFMGKAFSTIDKRSNIIIDKDAGIGFRYFDNMGDFKKKGKTLLRTYIEKAVTQKNFEEEMRLLYVAMTRAQENLYIQAMVPSGGFSGILEANSMIDWILSTLSSSGLSNDMFSSEQESIDIDLGGKWKVNFINPETLMNYTIGEETKISAEDFQKEFSIPFIPEAGDDIGFMQMVPVALSGSGIRNYGSTEHTESEFSMPGFMSTAASTTAEIGTAIHNFMKHLDFKGRTDACGLVEQAGHMVSEGVMSEDELKGIRFEKIADFLESPVGRQIKEADSYMREKTMNIIKKADEIGVSDTPEDVLVRCIADLIYKKDGKYFLVDYKTDRIGNADDGDGIVARIQEHRTQISLYIEAFEKIYKKPVTKAYLAFIDIGSAAEVVF